MFIAFSRDDKPRIDALLSAKPEEAAAKGPANGLASGSVDLGAMVELLAPAPDSPLATMSPEKLAQVRDMMRGQSLALSAIGEADGVTVRVTVPTRLIKTAIETATGGADNP